MTGAVDLWGCAAVICVVDNGGILSESGSDEEFYGGETFCKVSITDVDKSCYLISAVEKVNIAYGDRLVPSSDIASGCWAEYWQHDGAKGGELGPYIQEAAEAHEHGHAVYASTVIRSAIESSLHLLELRWRIYNWSESVAREEAKNVVDQVLVNHIIGFHNAANDSTIAYFNSSPEWIFVRKVENKEGIFWYWRKE